MAVAVEEHWFHKYYRVLVADDGDAYLVSIDVYRRGWDWGVDDEICIGEKNTCILYNRISREELRRELGGLAEHIYEAYRVGLRVGSRLETINIRARIKRKPGPGELEKLFYAAWRLAGCRARREEALGDEKGSI